MKKFKEFCTQIYYSPVFFLVGLAMFLFFFGLLFVSMRM